MTSFYRKKLLKYTKEAVLFNKMILDGVLAFKEIQETSESEEALIQAYQSYLDTAFREGEDNAIVEELSEIVNELIQEVRLAEEKYKRKIEKKRAKLN
jgi:hypothetical protein